jgi:uncharacterized membrane protein
MTIVLLLTLLAALVFVGRAQSEKIIVTLLLNGVILLSAAVLMLMGFHAVLIGWLCILGTSLLTLFYQNGLNPKTAAAFLSLLIVVALMSFLIWFVCVRAGLYGLDEKNWAEDDVVMLDLHLHISMIRVTYVVIVLGLLGAAKDSAMAVATGAYEVFQCHPEMSAREVFQSGMNIGRDILGVTINTLLFAVIGQSVLMIQMYFDCGYSFSQLMNAKSLFQSATVVLTGGIGVELSIPITALVLSALCTEKLKLPIWKKRAAEK